MALNKVPPIRPPKGAIYAAAIFLATFIFWFTRSEPEPSADRGAAAGTSAGAEKPYAGTAAQTRTGTARSGKQPHR